jgi:hypothetical protein
VGVQFARVTNTAKSLRAASLQRPTIKTLLPLFSVILAVVSWTAHAETPPATILLGSEHIKISPPYGFSEASKATPFLSRFFAVTVAPDQIPLGGFITDKEFQLAKTGAEPMLWHIAFAYTIPDFINGTFKSADFAEFRNQLRQNVKEAVQVTVDKTRKRFQQLGGNSTEILTPAGVFLDDASSFAYLAKSSNTKMHDGKPHIYAIGFVLVRGKFIALNLSKVCLSDVDVEWTKGAMKWWVDKLRSDNP